MPTSDGAYGAQDAREGRNCYLLLASATIRYMTPKTPTKPVPVRIPPEMVARIDRLRDLAPREAYVRRLLDRALAAEERKAKR
jgi:hypothetical protein